MGKSNCVANEVKYSRHISIKGGTRCDMQCKDKEGLAQDAANQEDCDVTVA